MKIDAHQHFWKYQPEEYGWIGEDMSRLRHDHLPDHLYKDFRKTGIEGSVVVQARQSTAETRWLIKLASENQFIKGIVGWADLCSEDLLKQQLDEFSQSSRLVGVRHVVQDEPDDNFMLRDDFLNGISLLQQYRLVYDLLLFPKHLPVATQLVAMFPQQKFVLDHISKPDIRHRVIHPWKEDIQRLASFPNVYCKISGMVTETDWNNQKPEDFYKYLAVVFEAFGPNRIMFGSDWPVCLLAGEYSYVLNILEGYIQKMPNNIQDKIMGLNCKEIYSLRN